MTCLEKKAQPKLGIIILVLPSCVVAVLIVVISCIKKAKKFSRLSDPMIQPIFGNNELEARDNGSTVPEPYYEEILDHVEVPITHPGREEHFDPTDSI